MWPCDRNCIAYGKPRAGGRRRDDRGASMQRVEKLDGHAAEGIAGDEDDVTRLMRFASCLLAAKPRGVHPPKHACLARLFQEWLYVGLCRDEQMGGQTMLAMLAMLAM